jgi:hypothetical protein
MGWIGTRDAQCFGSVPAIYHLELYQIGQVVFANDQIVLCSLMLPPPKNLFWGVVFILYHQFLPGELTSEPISPFPITGAFAPKTSRAINQFPPSRLG